MTKFSQEIPLAPPSLLWSQRQDFLNIHPAPFPITPNKEGPMEMRDEVLSSVGAHKRVSSVWSGRGWILLGNSSTGLCPQTRHRYTSFFFNFNLFEKGALTDNPILIDEEQDKENSPPPHLIVPLSGRRTQPPLLMRSCPFGTRIENAANLFMEICFNILYSCFCACILI